MKLYIYIISFLILGCGQNSTSQNINSSGSDTSVDLTGTWTGCRALGGDSFFSTIVVSSNNISITIDTYSGNTDCSGQNAFTSIKSGTFSITGTTENVTGYSGDTVLANHFDITVTAFTMTPKTIGIVSVWNFNSVCGANDWVLSAAKNTIDLTNCDPAFSGNNPDEITNGTIENIFFIDSSFSPHRLYTNIAVSSNGTTTARPTTLNSSDGSVIEIELQ